MGKKLFVNLRCDFVDAIIRRNRRRQQKRIYCRRRTQVRRMANPASRFVVPFFVPVDYNLHHEQH